MSPKVFGPVYSIFSLNPIISGGPSRMLEKSASRETLNCER